MNFVTHLPWIPQRHDAVWVGLVIEPLSSGSGLGSARKAQLELGS